MKIISVDFDNTLTRPDVQEFVKQLMNRGVEVSICTSRYDDHHINKLQMYNRNNNDLYTVADEMGIKSIIFTNMSDKYEFLMKDKFILHLDDDWYELKAMQNCKKCKTIPISVIGSYQPKILRILF